VPAIASCTGCAENFCGNCLVDIGGKKYCAQCKTMAVSADAGPRGVCEEAGSALKYAIIGIFCFGIILEPIALIKALNAKKQIAANPNLEGSGKATAAMIIAIISLVLWVLGIIGRIAMAQ
jgi:hypothetical protein